MPIFKTDCSGIATIVLSLWVIVGITNSVLFRETHAHTMNEAPLSSSSSSSDDAEAVQFVGTQVAGLSNTTLFHVQGAHGSLSFAAFVHALQHDDKSPPSLLSSWLDFLRREAETRGAFFFECAPVNEATFATARFQFALVTSQALAQVSEDRASFREHFPASRDDATVVAFENLSRDAQLVVPVPLDGANFAHLATFSLTAPRAEQATLWRRVAAELKARVAANGVAPVWLSTSGLGVYFLHVRICDSPKYYTTRGLMRFDQQQ
jgi:hypothetical protein